MSFHTLVNNSPKWYRTQEHLPIKHGLLTASSQAESVSVCLLCCQPCWTGQSSVWGRWTVSRSYYGCNYTHLRPPWEHTAKEVHTKTHFSSERQPNSKVCVNTHKHPYILHNLDRKTTPLLAGISATAPSHPPICIFGRPYSSEALARRVWWICEPLPHLTQIDPVGQKNGGSTCSKIVNYHFKERLARLNKTPPSMHQRRCPLSRQGYTTKRMCSVKFYFPPKPTDAFTFLSLLHQQKS